MNSGPKSFLLTQELSDYLLAHGARPDPVQQALIDETTALGDISIMQISPEQGAFLTLLTRLVGAREAIEVGTFTGYSALCIARGLPEGGRLVCCDISEEWTSIGRRFWSEAGLDHKITLEIAPALETLRAMPTDERFDLAFIDADKESYVAYYEETLMRTRPGGVILVDNVLWSGNVVRPEADDDMTKQIKTFNDLVAADGRVDSMILPIADGLTLARKR
jgi:caffeoyl-CoA O-methyltransferase